MILHDLWCVLVCFHDLYVFGLLGFRPSHTYPPVSVLSHQRPAVIDGSFSPGAMTRPPITPVPPADVFGPGAVTRPQPLIELVPPANVFGPRAVTRPLTTPAPPANVFGPGAVTRPPIASVPPTNVFDPGAMARPPITHIPPANVFGPGAVTRPSIALISLANVFGSGAMARPPITHVPPSNVFGFGAMARPPITPVPPANVFGPGTVARPPITHLPPANVFGFGAMTRPPITPVPPANVFGPGAVTRPSIAPVPPANVFGHGAMTRRPITPVPPVTDFGPEAVTRSPITPVPSATDFGPEAVTRSPITPVPPATDFGPEAVTRSPIALGNGDTRSDAPEQRKIRRQRENEEHLRDSKVVCLQGWKDREVTSPGKFSLQIDAISSMYVPMECESTVEHERKRQHRESDCISSMHVPIERESTVEHERKRQHRERDVFHKRNGEGKDIVSVSGLVSDKLNSSTPGKRVSFELQATSKSGNKETLDEEQLLAAVPKTKEELFAYDVNWAIYDKHGLHERMRPWVSEKSTEVFGEEIAEFVEYVVASTKEHVDAPRMLETLASLMDDSAENFVLSLWTQLIFEIKKVETGLA
uniref:Predicted protein n=1 Tax=Hordeum vulgare subsp. vulgare TaxID=112509 RepID=F2DJC6_HORVV|nr:predicted protein [Hordeum vulgare subsp. vulgare]